MRALPLLLSLLALPAACRAPSAAEAGPAAGAPFERTAGLERRDGLLPLALDPAEGRLWMEVPLDGRELLWLVRLSGGLGSNDVGLDRGQVGSRQVVRFVDVGPRVLLVAPNQAWRSSADEPAERRAARESFAASVLFGFEVVERRAGRVLVDATPFLLGDAHGVARALEDAGQGSFALDPSRSAIDPGHVLAFPDNVDVEVLQTFACARPGPEVRSTAPLPEALTLRVRHGFVALPPLDPERFRPRAWHPRSGFQRHAWSDVSAPLGEPLERSVLPRHRLDAEHPIVYWIDRGAPEPVRTALLEGARFWCDAFAAAGFPGGFRAELLPAGADPHELGRNVVQWVDRSTRGWSYGDSILDPRTGEILKGHVTLGALRVRQDVAILEGLLAPYDEGRDGEAAPEVLEAALARIRQLAAHEVGHTLGLTHNFAASAEGRASVMDYPVPRVTLDGDGTPGLDQAYAPGLGAWDRHAIRYGYAAFADLAAERAGLERILAEADAAGLSFAGDQDARGLDRAHPAANLWDDGDDALAALEHALAVRAGALGRFSAAVLRRGRPLAGLEPLLVPVYLHHRYQLEAAIRQIGGRDYRHLVRGEEGEDPLVAAVPAARQRRALRLALACLEPAVLALPAGLAERIPPPAPETRRTRESFAPGGLVFDPLRAAEAAVELVLDPLLDSARVARLVDQARADPELPSFEADLGEALLARFVPPEPGAGEALGQLVRAAVLRHLIELARDARSPLRVRSAALALLARIEARVQGLEGPVARFEADLLRRFREAPETLGELADPRVPPGSPIGCGGPW